MMRALMKPCPLERHSARLEIKLYRQSSARLLRLEYLVGSFNIGHYI